MYLGDYLDTFKTSCKELSDFAVANGVDICFENTEAPPYLQRAFEEVVKHSGLWLTFDVGHDAADKTRVKDTFFRTPTKIKHFHLHDYTNGKAHGEIGTGSIDIKNYFQFCKENNLSVVVEVKSKPELQRSVEFLMKIV